MCHATAKPESIAVTTTAGRFLPSSKHRKRLLLTIATVWQNHASKQVSFGAAVPVSVTVVPDPGFEISLEGIMVNCTAAYTTTWTLKDGATIVSSGNLALVANTDVLLQIPNGGMLFSPGNTLTLTFGTNTPAASTTTVNVAASEVPSTPPRVSISPEPGVTIDRGLTINAGIDPVEVNEETAGDWLEREIFIVSNIALTVSVVDIAERGPAQGAHFTQDEKILLKAAFDKLMRGGPTYEELQTALSHGG